jgi:hypothetical protein
MARSPVAGSSTKSPARTTIEAWPAFTTRQPFGVRVHIVLPGRSPTTQFGANARPHLRGFDDPDYKPMIEGMIKQFQEDTGPVTYAEDVAAAVFEAATNPSAPLKIPAGADAIAWMADAA